jgi:aerobic-type carbon monoxide dehydrogenase small subunit (CoxS/CutS family)
MSNQTITFTLNGRDVSVAVSATARLLDVLREDLACTEVKEGCGEGECGACTVLLDGAPVTSCALFAWQIAGRTITTVAGLAPETLARIKEAMVRHGAVQCGFCTPGFVLSIKWLLEQPGGLDAASIQEALSGNLCRCTGYQKIIDAVLELGAGGVA